MFQTEELISQLKSSYPDNVNVYEDATEVVLNSDIIISCVSDPAAVKDVSNITFFSSLKKKLNVHLLLLI